jgi:hypothetical protein
MELLLSLSLLLGFWCNNNPQFTRHESLFSPFAYSLARIPRFYCIDFGNLTGEPFPLKLGNKNLLLNNGHSFIEIGE